MWNGIQLLKKPDNLRKGLQSLTVQGLLIIGLGTAIQLGSLMAYDVLLEKADRLTEIQLKDKAVLVQTNWLSLLLPICGMLALDPSQKNAGQPHLQDGIDLVYQARDYIGPMLNKKDAKAINDTTDAIIKECTRIAGIVEANRDITVAQLSSTCTFKELYKNFAQARLGVILQNRRNSPMTMIMLAKTQNQPKQLLHLLIAATIITAILATVFFLRGVCVKLSNLEDNMRRFERGEELTPFVERGDEIGQLERRFRELAKALIETDMQKQEIVSMVSHDLRSPLSSVQAILTLLALETLEPLPPESKIMIGKAQRNLARMVNLVNDLLDIELISSGQLTLAHERISFHQLAQECKELLFDSANAREIAIEITVEEYALWADKERIGQILANLLGNALKFSKNGSNVQITCQALSEKMCEVAVVDHGRGVPDEFKLQIFERFKQVSTQDRSGHKGSGLGLAIAKKLIEMHGGAIGIRDTEGGGSTFWFTVAKSESDNSALL